jgi:proline iminopeptidase
MERLRKHLKLDKIILFGGSWGATLGLAYAEAYPENVSGMVLRGIFTATKEEIDHFYRGGVSKFFPETYEKLLSSLPEPEKQPLPDYLLSLVQSKDSSDRAKYSRAWAEYEIKLASLEFPDDAMDHIFKEFNPYAFALLENFYMANDCFLEEGQLLKDVHKIHDIPLVMVNGRYDMVCPPITAYRIHQELPKSKLVIAEGSGHWMGEKNIEKAMLEAMRDFE